MTDWHERLTSAVGSFGYQTLRTSEVTAAQVQGIGAAQARQRDSRVAVAQPGDWAAVMTSLHQLEPLGISIAAFRFEYILHLVLGCTPVQGLELPRVDDFRQSIAPWLHAFRAALPREKLNDSGKVELHGLLSAAGIGGAAAALLGSLAAEGPTAVDCLMVFPGWGASAAYIAQWQRTDLVSEPVEDPYYRCWLWTPETNSVYPSGHGRAESGRDAYRGHIDTPEDLARALRNVR